MKRPDFPLGQDSSSRESSRARDARVTPVRRLPVRQGHVGRMASPRADRRKPRETSAARRHREDAADARHALREARKARKAFERNEVRRFTARVRRRRQAWAAAALSLIAVIVFVIVGIFSPVMRVQTIQVTGTTRVDPVAISTQLADQVGQPLPLVNVARVEEVLRRQTLVESYSIESRPPNTLIVHVVERQPVIYMPAGLKFELKDAAGVTIESVTEYPGGFPLLRVPNDETTGVAFTAAVGVLRTLPSEIRDRISEVTATTADDVVFTFADTGQRVFWGSVEEAALKVRSLIGLMANWPPGSANEYDVSSTDNVVVR